MEKILKFTPELTQLIKDGSKTVTIRLFDDKNLTVGDKIILATRDGDKVTNFGEAIIDKIALKKIESLTDEDFIGHEKVENPLVYYRKYYGNKVKINTEVKIIKLKDIKIDT